MKFGLCCDGDGFRKVLGMGMMRYENYEPW